MSTEEPTRHHAFHHEATCYGSDEELLAAVVPFLLDGVAAGEPSLVSLCGRSGALVRAALPVDSGVVFLTGDEVYRRPASAIRSFQQLLAFHATDGTTRVRVAGELPPESLGVTWDWWARYESAINHAYAEYPLWSMCLYDRRTTPAAVLEDVARTHPRLVTADGRHTASPVYTDPAIYLREDRPMVPDPLQRTPPVLELVDPSPAQARRAVYHTDRGRLPAPEVEDFVVAVSEAVTNALRHGHPPVRVRYWAGERRVVVTVSDGGKGPEDPFAGLLPAAGGATGGLGLWITYQSCSHVTLRRDRGSFTLRLTAGDPHFAH